MDYVLFTPEDQAETLRSVLRGAEQDHFMHSLEAVAAQAALDALPAKPPGKDDPDPDADKRVNAQSKVTERGGYRDAAEKLAAHAKDQLDALDAPYVKPEPAEDAAVKAVKAVKP